MRDSMISFSIIVPVYKVEQYLDDCVNSVLSQSYKNFELILVDDGSPDSCPQKCDEFQLSDQRVKVIHKKTVDYHLLEMLDLILLVVLILLF